MTFNYNGCKVFYKVTGNGTPVLLLHGFLENHKIWKSLVYALEKKYRVITLDLPGHGLSELPETELDMEYMSEIIAALLDYLKITGAHLVGHSMGGYVGLAYAKAYSERTLSLVLLNSTPLNDDASRIKSRKHGMKVAAKNYPAIVKMSVANLFAHENKSILKEKIDQLKVEALKTPLAGYMAAQRAMTSRPDLTKFFKEAGFKKLLILGEGDALIETEAHMKLFSNTSVRIEVLPGGHQLLIENFSSTCNIIIDFLK